ncbi:hypothetical protein L9F63_024922, partial [Diploptera punctata]
GFFPASGWKSNAFAEKKRLQLTAGERHYASARLRRNLRPPIAPNRPAILTAERREVGGLRISAPAYPILTLNG